MMKLMKKNIREQCIRWTVVVLMAFSPALYSCSDNQAQQEQDSNIGEEQTSFEVDTTATGGRGGTDNSMGRADTDTSGTGRQMTNDTVNKQ
jgi:hypothetical protein